jgi:tetraacyldisaccharide 4'-kinase
MPDERPRGAVERVWFGRGLGARSMRAVLLPASALFRAGVAARDLAFRLGLAKARRSRIPVVSVGNLSVGGTGKTPIAAWFAAELRRLGARPAIVMRGVGADETRVHALLNPEVPVIASPDRLAGIAIAAADGADVAVLDDAFQHRRAARDADVVLVSADAWSRPRHLLPAGAWREPLRALRRASMAIVTRKAADDAGVSSVLRAIGRAAPRLPVAVVRLAPDELRRLDAPEESLPLSALERREVLAIAAIGDPAAFLAQIAAAGPESVEWEVFADHHPFSQRDVARLQARGRGVDIVVCTLKDAVKLGPSWTRATAPLWYVSQRVVVESGGERVASLLAELLRCRPASHAVGASPDGISQPS